MLPDSDLCNGWLLSKFMRRVGSDTASAERSPLSSSTISRARVASTNKPSNINDCAWPEWSYKPSLSPNCFLLRNHNYKVPKCHAYGPGPYALYLWRKHRREVDKQKHLPSRASLSPGSMLFTDRRIYSLYSGKGTGFREESISFENFWMKIPLMPCSSCCVSFFSAWAFVWFRPMRANSSGVMSPSPFKSVNWNSFFAASMRSCSNTFTSWLVSLHTSEQSQKGIFPISADNGETYKRTVRWKPILRGIKNIQHSTRLLVMWCQMCFWNLSENIDPS